MFMKITLKIIYSCCFKNNPINRAMNETFRNFIDDNIFQQDNAALQKLGKEGEHERNTYAI